MKKLLLLAIVLLSFSVQAQNYLYKYDILNRFPSHTLTSTTRGALITWTLKNASSVEVGHATGMLGVNIVRGNNLILKKLRDYLDIQSNLLPHLTTTERNTIQNDIPISIGIYNITDDAVQIKGADNNWLW